MAAKRQHPYSPDHMTNRGNVRACCDQPESAHPAWKAGEKVRVVLTRDVTFGYPVKVVRKGTSIVAERDSGVGYMREIRPSVWKTNERGNLEEFRGEYENVSVPGWTIDLTSAGWVRTAIPYSWAREQ